MNSDWTDQSTEVDDTECPTSFTALSQAGTTIITISQTIVIDHNLQLTAKHNFK